MESPGIAPSRALPRRPRTRRVLAGALATAFALLLPAGAAPAAPRISFDSELCDLGSVVQGEQPACEFAFANDGDEQLRILQVEPACGCTTALLTDPLVRPGGRGALRVVFDSQNFAGDVVKEVEVRTNDAVRPLLTLRVKALVEPEVDFEPRTVTFSGVAAGAHLRQLATLTNRRAEPVRILRVEGRPASFHCFLPSWADVSRPLVLESWDRSVVEVSFSAPASLVMPIAGECVLEIEGPRMRDFRLKILALPGP